jgi:hypothetical protein
VTVEAPTFTPPQEFVAPTSTNGATPMATESAAPEAAASSQVFVWEDPPVSAPRGRAAGRSNQQHEFFSTSVLPQLQAHPGRYAKVLAFPKRNAAQGRLKRLREEYPQLDFVARASGTQEGKPVEPQWSAIYAAWAIDGGVETAPAGQ